MGHPQPQTLIQTNNSTAEGVINNKIQPKWTKAMDMHFHCYAIAKPKADLEFNGSRGKQTWRITSQNIIHPVTMLVQDRIFDQSQRTTRSTIPERRRTDQIQVHYKLNSYKGVLDFLKHTYIQKLHTLAKRAFSSLRILNSPCGRFAAKVFM
jgi:hypothetical protein